MAHIVKSALVVALDAEGKHRYLYRGAQVPEDVPAAEVERLANEGFIVDPEAPVDSAEGEAAKPSSRGRGRS